MSALDWSLLGVGGVILAFVALAALLDHMVSRREPPAPQLPLEKIMPREPPTRSSRELPDPEPQHRGRSRQ